MHIFHFHGGSKQTAELVILEVYVWKPHGGRGFDAQLSESPEMRRLIPIVALNGGQLYQGMMRNDGIKNTKCLQLEFQILYQEI